MELGIGMFGDLGVNQAGLKISEAERLQQMLEEVKLADQVGLDVVTIGEHHRPDYAVTSPEIFLAAASSVTKNIRLSSGVTVLSSSDPMRIYQNFAMIDSISSGRAEIMVGRGSFIESFPLYGYDLSDYHTLFEEKFKLLMKINTEKVVTWNGQFRGPLNKQTIYPQRTKPLPMWVAVGGTPESVHRAASNGLPIMFAIIGGNPASFNPLMDYYREVYQASGFDLKDLQLGIQPHVFVGADAQATADAYYPYYEKMMNRLGRERGWPPFSRERYEMARDLSGAIYVGDADQVAEKIIYYREMFDLTRFVAQIDVGAPQHMDLMKCIEFLGDKVAPIVRKHTS